MGLRRGPASVRRALLCEGGAAGSWRGPRPLRTWLGARAMAIRDTTAANGGVRSTSKFAVWFGGTLAIMVISLLAGVGVAAMLGRRGTAQDWSKWSDVGQTFGVLSSVISGLALAALVVTARAQFREMQANRIELEQQRQALARTAEANLRMVHLEILRMSIDDPDLAEVWPRFETSPSVAENRQFLYANIIFQFHWMSLRVGGYTDDEIMRSVGYLFRSPIMRDYWRAAAPSRAAALEPDSAEEIFARRLDELCSIYEAVASANGPRRSRVAEPRPGVPFPGESRIENEAA
jgi:hypothetical protein